MSHEGLPGGAAQVLFARTPALLLAWFTHIAVAGCLAAGELYEPREAARVQLFESMCEDVKRCVGDAADATQGALSRVGA